MTSKSPATARRRITPQPISSAAAPAAGRVAGAFAHPQAVAPGSSGLGSAAASKGAGGEGVNSGILDIAALPPPASAALVPSVPKGRRIHVKMDLDNVHVSWSRLLKSEGLDPRRAGAPSAGTTAAVAAGPASGADVAPGATSWMDSVIARYEKEYGWNVAEMNEGASSEDDDGSPADAAAAGQQASAAANATDREAGAGSGGEGGDGEAGEEGVGEGRMNDYDRSDPFIDDSDVLAYRQSDRRKTKFSGFYVNKGTIEKLGEPEPSADAGKKGKKRGRPKASDPAAAPAEASGKEPGRRPKAAPKSDSAPVGGGGGGGAAGAAERSAPAASKPGKRRAADEGAHEAKKQKRSQEAAQLNGIAAASPGSTSPMRSAAFPARTSGAGASLASMAAAAGAMAAERAPPTADADLGQGMAADGRGRGGSGTGMREGQDDRTGPASVGTSSSDAARIAMEAFMAAGPSLGGAAGSCDGAAGSSAAAAAAGPEGTGTSRGRKGAAARSSSGGRQQQYEMSAELLDAIDKLRALVEADARPDGGAPKRLPKAIIAELKAIGLLVFKECGESRKAKAQVIQEIMQFMEVISSEATVRSHISSARREKEAEVLSARAILKERIARLIAEATDSWHEQQDADGSGSQTFSFTLDEDVMRSVRLLAKLELELLTSGVHSPAAMDAFSRIADLFSGCRGMSGELVKTIFTQPAAAAPELEVQPSQDAEPTPTEPRSAALPASPTPSPAVGHSLPPLSPGSRGMLMVPRLTATHLPEAAIPNPAAREAPAAGQQSPSAAHVVPAEPGQATASAFRDHALEEQQQELLQLFRARRLQGTLPPGLDGVGEEQLRCIDPHRPDFQSLLNYLKSS